MDKLPPNNIEAEEAVLGSVLLDPGVLDTVREYVHPSDFYREKNNWVYAAMGTVHDKHGRVDVVTLCDELDRNGQLADVGGAAYISTLMNAVPSCSHAEYYAKIVERDAIMRRLIHAGTEIVRIGYDDGDITVAVDKAQRSLAQVSSRYTPDSAVLSKDASLVWYNDLLERREVERKENKPYMTFPWISLEPYVKRVRPEMLSIVAAFPGVGKTTWCECCAEHWSRHGFNGLFFHFELSHEIMLDRRMARVSDISIDDLENGVYNNSLLQAHDRITEWPGELTYIYCAGWTMQRVAMQARKLASRQKLSWIAVDYMQKAAFPDKERGLTPAQMRGQDVETLKVLAGELGVHILLASQMNREATQTGRKTGHTIRDTGEALEKCNLLFTMDRQIRDSDFKDSTGKILAKAGSLDPLVTVRVDKNTMGQTGECKLVFVGSRFDIADIVQQPTSPKIEVAPWDSE